jgi:hypothetical protein
MSATVPKDFPVGQDLDIENSATDVPGPTQAYTNVCVYVLIFNKKFKKQKNTKMIKNKEKDRV